MSSPLRLTAEKLVPGGYALGHSDEHPVFIWNALPGETVELNIIRKRKGCWYGVAQRVLEASPDRIEPPESHFLTCSPWQIMTEPSEIAAKCAIIKELASLAVPEQALKHELAHQVSFQYRNKLEISFTEGQGGLATMAFHERERSGFVAITRCALAHPALNAVLGTFQDALWRNRIVPEQLKTLVVRSTARGEVMASLYVTHRDFPALDPEPCPGLVGYRIVYSDPRYSDSVVTEILRQYGASSIQETILSKPFLFSDQCFFQVNIPLFEQALCDIRDATHGAGAAYDLFSGVGAIGLSLDAQRVTLIELDAQGVAYARRNAALHRNTDVEIVSQDASRYDAYEPHATVVCDPPRAGLTPRLIQALLKARPKRIAYLSCNPITQMRDLALLSPSYIPVLFKAYNFFPRTPHIETLAVLDRAA